MKKVPYPQEWRRFVLPEDEIETPFATSPDLQNFLLLRKAAAREDGSMPRAEELWGVGEIVEAMRGLEHFVCRRAGKVVGAMSINTTPAPNAESVWLDTIAIVPDFRGRGLGALGLRLAALLAKDRGARRIGANAVQNPQTLEFYSRNGFRRNGARELYVPIVGDVDEVLNRTVPKIKRGGI
jgi:GNAT superfamily N-acetyltransferase